MKQRENDRPVCIHIQATEEMKAELIEALISFNEAYSDIRWTIADSDAIGFDLLIIECKASDLLWLGRRWQRVRDAGESARQPTVS